MASEYKTLRILFAVPEAGTEISGSGGSSQYDFESGDWLRLEQVPYEEKPLGDFNQWLLDNDMGLSLDSILPDMAVYKSECEDVTGDLKTDIRVHKSRSDLQYSIKASFGILSPKTEQSASVEDSFNVRGVSSTDLNMVVSDSTTADWEGDVVDANGDFLVPPPPITISNNVASWGQSVTGTFRLSGSASYDVYTLTITPRPIYDDSKPETAYQSTIAVNWAGGVEVLEVTLPVMEGNCLEAVWGSVVFNPDDEDEDEERCVRLIEVRDPCTGDLISSREETIVCPDEDTETE